MHFGSREGCSGYKILLTADKTLMCNYGDSLFYGFLSAAPRKGAKLLSPEILFRMFFHKVPTDETGRALLAPLGLRRIESSLLTYGQFSMEVVLVCNPADLAKFISDSTRMIGISVIDPMGRGPASSTFGGYYGMIHEEPFNAYNFRKLVRSNSVQEARSKGVKLVVGGPGAWQLGPNEMNDFGIDIVVDGEAELTFPDIAKRIINGELETPASIKTDFERIPEFSQIPPTVGGAVGGLVEISRGCGRGCKFCMPTLRKIRFRSVPDILKDVRTNVKSGQTNVILHAEDVLRYGTYGVIPEHEKVVNLFRAVKEVEGVVGISVSHAALASIATSPGTVGEISDLMNLDWHHWIGFQTGIETGSPVLIQNLMSRKAAPFKSSEWARVVESAFATCHDNNWVPAATLVVNLPGESEQDVLWTIELLEDLRSYRSFIVPLLFVPFGDQQFKQMRFLEDAEYYHFELYKKIWEHDMRWINVLIGDYIRGNQILTKLALRTIGSIFRNVLSRPIENYIDKNIRERKQNLAPKPSIAPPQAVMEHADLFS